MTSVGEALEALGAACTRIRDERPVTAEDLALDRDLAVHLAGVLGIALEAASEAAAAFLNMETTTFTTAINALRAQQVLDETLALELVRLGQLRRASADGYTGIDTTRLHEALNDGVTTLEAFARALRHS